MRSKPQIIEYENGTFAIQEYMICGYGFAGPRRMPCPPDPYRYKSLGEAQERLRSITVKKIHDTA